MANYSYVQAVGQGFPLVNCHANGRGEQYAELTWDSGDPLPSQATLDAWIIANPIPVVTPVNSMQVNASGVMEYWNGSAWVSAGTAITDSDPIGAIYTGLTAAMTGTGTIPADHTIPLNTEGTQIWSQVVTPASANSRFKFDQTLVFDTATSLKSMTIALFRNTTCVYAFNAYLRTSGQPIPVPLTYLDSPATASAVTYSLRVGVNSSATWYLNQANGATITFGGVANQSSWVIMEIK